MKLTGLKVLDLSAFLPGPHMTMMMADHGADVVMVEPANGVGEPTRVIGWKTGDGVSVWFRNIARGKKSLKINLKDVEARALFLALAREADVIVEAFRPGVVARLGVDYDTVAAINPRIVYCSISGFGQEGAYVNKPGHDLTMEAMAGLVDLNRGLTDDKPASPAIPAADMAGSLMALSAILMALYRREQTGRGDFIDISMYDALLSWTANVQGPVFADDAHPVAKQMRPFGGAAMYRPYETADGKFLVLGGSEHHFAKNLLDALGRPDLFDLAKLEPGPGQDPLKRFFEETFASRTLDDWSAFLKGVDLCWAPVRTLKDAMDDPYTASRGMVLQDGDGNRHLGVPIRFRDEPGKPDLTLPAYGQHSSALARDAGLAEDVIEALLARGAI
ncbi:MAG: CoA transferase [Hyphomonadaceae bacterium]|jgi:crotonobetainyl-CoA:carnitine CoA-transferase CaiB-like acyl-CoA transferase|nr:CoA transferase [Hyphomonadaceae bacterium]